MPSCGEINPYRSSCALLLPTPKASLSPHRASAYLFSTPTLFPSKAGRKNEKNGPAAPFSFPAELPVVRWALSRLFNQGTERFHLLLAGGSPSVEQSPFVTPTQLFFSIFHLSQKADEAGRNLRASPGLASLCARNRWCVGRPFKSSAATNSTVLRK